ncbi:hypothetical protein ACFOGG_14130 [Brenneria rubrifaciens]
MITRCVVKYVGVVGECRVRRPSLCQIVWRSCRHYFQPVLCLSDASWRLE